MAKKLPGRARVIYQSEALYVGTVDATGHHFADKDDNSQATSDGNTTKTGIQQLRRVQSANYSFSINRQDVNQFGQLARIDSVSIEPPTVTLDYSYYLTNGLNERLMGMNVSGDSSALASEIIDGVVCGEDINAGGKNYFILTTCEGHDAVGNESHGDTQTAGNPDVKENSVIALGNGFVSNYSIEAAVGSMPTASVTVDGLNLRSYTGTQNLDSPAVNTNFGTPIKDIKFSLPPAVSGVLNDSSDDAKMDEQEDGWSCLRPGDITLSLGTDGRASEFELLPGEDPRASEFAKTLGGQSINAFPSWESGKAYEIGDIVQHEVTGVTHKGLNLFKALVGGTLPEPTGDTSDWDLSEDQKFNDNTPLVSIQDDPNEDYTVPGSAHIQSFSIDVPLSRTVLNRLGTPYGYSRVVDYPVNISVSVNAILADLKEGNIANLLWNTEEHDLVFTMREPAQYGNGPVAMQYIVKGALLEGEAFSSSIGDNKSVDVTFTAQVGGPEDKARGLYVLGSRNALHPTGLPGWYDGKK